MNLPHTVILLPAVEHVDSYGTPQRLPAPTGPVSKAFVQQRGSRTEQRASEEESGRVVDVYLCFLPPDVDLDAWAYVRWNGELFEVDGTPARLETLSGPHHVEARLRKVR